jgi:hypothetical protein
MFGAVAASTSLDQPGGLSREDLPELYRKASDYSKLGQRTNVALSAVQLVLLGGGAVLGAVDLRFSNGVHLGAIAAAVALCLALIPAAILTVRHPQRQWYLGRIFAESVKTFSWQYAVRAGTFSTVDDPDRRLSEEVGQLHERFQQVPDLAQGSPLITGAMRALRAAPLDARRTAYLDGRVEAGAHWYSGRAARYALAARWWSVLAIAATAIGLIFGLLNAFGVIVYDGLGAASAIAAAATAWLQLKQYRPLGAAYLMAARQLQSLRTPLTLARTEEEWAVAAAKAEEAIASEHSMWLVRREVS